MQDDIFEKYEGDNWFQRNRTSLFAGKSDFVTNMIEICNLQPRKIIELGCSNGYRLETLRLKYNAECVGIDSSAEAIADGKNNFPTIKLQHCTLGNFKTNQQYDLVICNFVLHWIDRNNLLTAIQNIDACVLGGGHLLLETFCLIFNKKDGTIICKTKKYIHTSKTMLIFLL